LKKSKSKRVAKLLSEFPEMAIVGIALLGETSPNTVRKVKRVLKEVA
jgi:hypothetical protein